MDYILIGIVSASGARCDDDDERDNSHKTAHARKIPHIGICDRTWTKSGFEIRRSFAGPRPELGRAVLSGVPGRSGGIRRFVADFHLCARSFHRTGQAAFGQTKTVDGLVFGGMGRRTVSGSANAGLEEFWLLRLGQAAPGSGSRSPEAHSEDALGNRSRCPCRGHRPLVGGSAWPDPAAARG
ncbi:MAG: hypothetical protein RL173_3083 [Fibrobacterota bacterium]